MNQCQKCGSSLTLSLFVFEWLDTGVTTNSVTAVLASIILLLLPKWKQIWIYFTCQAQYNVPKSANNAKWHTRVQMFIHGIVSSLIWCVAAGLEKMTKKNDKNEKKYSQKNSAVEWWPKWLIIFTCLYPCVGCTLSLCPVCNWNPPSLFLYGWLVRVYDSFPVPFKFKSIKTLITYHRFCKHISSIARACVPALAAAATAHLWMRHFAPGLIYALYQIYLVSNLSANITGIPHHFRRFNCINDWIFWRVRKSFLLYHIPNFSDRNQCRFKMSAP